MFDIIRLILKVAAIGHILIILQGCSSFDIECEDLRHYPNKKCEVKIGDF